MEVRVDYLKLESSTHFGAFANRTFGSIMEARGWLLENVPENELDLVRVWIDGRSISGRELRDVTGESDQ